MRGEALRVDERDNILRGIAAGLSGRAIAAGLGRNPAVVSREIARNGGRDQCRVHAAQERFEVLRARPKLRKLEADRRLHYAVRVGTQESGNPSCGARQPDNQARRHTGSAQRRQSSTQNPEYRH